MTNLEHGDAMVTDRLDLIAEMAPDIHATGCLPPNSKQQAHSCGAPDDVAALVAFARDVLAMGESTEQYTTDEYEQPLMPTFMIRDAANRHLGD